MNVKKQLDEMGVALVAVGSGTPEQARVFIEKFKFEGEVYLDPSLAAYNAFRLKRGFWRTLGPCSIGRGFKTMFRGFHQGRKAGDLWQQGGLFVMGPGNQVVFAHRNGRAGKQADLNIVLKAAAEPGIPIEPAVQ
nr:peroxiredoxin-like family protein [Desulfosudis oleivorans]